MDRPIEPEVRRNRNLRQAAIAALSLAAQLLLCCFGSRFWPICSGRNELSSWEQL